MKVNAFKQFKYANAHQTIKISSVANPKIRILMNVWLNLCCIWELFDACMPEESDCGTSTGSSLPSVVVSKSMHRCNLSWLRPLFA